MNGLQVEIIRSSRPGEDFSTLGRSNVLWMRPSLAIKRKEGTCARYFTAFLFLAGIHLLASGLCVHVFSRVQASDRIRYRLAYSAIPGSLHQSISRSTSRRAMRAVGLPRWKSVGWPYPVGKERCAGAPEICTVLERQTRFVGGTNEHFISTADFTHINQTRLASPPDPALGDDRKSMLQEGTPWLGVKNILRSRSYGLLGKAFFQSIGMFVYLNGATLEFIQHTGYGVAVCRQWTRKYLSTACLTP